jgi:hypothetical protein
MDDRLKRQTSAATPAEPEDLPWWVRVGRRNATMSTGPSIRDPRLSQYGECGIAVGALVLQRLSCQARRVTVHLLRGE